MNKEIKYLTGVRGVAVILVFIAHEFPGHSFNLAIAYLGMSMFFMLSGTVLTYTWGNKINLSQTSLSDFMYIFSSFIWARFSRLAPLYILVAIPYFVSAGRSTEEICSYLPRYIFAAQSWFYDVNATGQMNQLLVYAFSWSISSEVWLYLIFPIGLLLCNSKKGWIIIFNAFITYLIVVFLIAKMDFYSGLGFPPSQTFFDWFVYISPYGRLFEFLIGILLGVQLQKSPRNLYKSFHGILAIILLVTAIIFLSINQSSGNLKPTLALLRMGPLFTLPLFYLMFALAKGNDVTEIFFSNRLITNIGKWSYSIYLLQGLATPVAGTLWMDNKFGVFIKYLTHFTIIILISAGSFQLIETPARQFLLALDPVKKLFRIFKLNLPINERP